MIEHGVWCTWGGSGRGDVVAVVNLKEMVEQVSYPQWWLVWPYWRHREENSKLELASALSDEW